MEWNIDQSADRSAVLASTALLGEQEPRGPGSVGPGTLLGPEGAGDCFFGPDPSHMCGGLLAVDHPAPDGADELGVRGEAGAGTARTLRIAQWTRASLWSRF